MTMDPKKELNFPTTETETYNMTAVAMLADIVEFLLFDEEIRRAGLNIYSNNQAALTPENYVTCRGIVLNYIESQINDHESMWHKFVTETDASKAIKFLKSESISDGKDWINDLLQNRKRELAHALIIVKTQIHLHLKDFLSGTVNQNYGSAGLLRPEVKYAVPYVAANTPSKGSVFADRWETLVKTLLMISASPCSIEISREVIKYSARAIANESSVISENKIENSATYVTMNILLSGMIDPMLLDDKEDTHIKLAHNALVRRSPAAIRVLFVYFINEVLAKMEFPVEQITSNALHMTSMFASVQGYSGTIDNVNILPQRVVEAAAIDRDKNEINNGGISLKLINDCNNAVIPELPDDSFSKNAFDLMGDFFNLFEGNNQVPIDQVSAIIDTGAFFKNFKNRQVAEAILRMFEGRIEAVLYYDEVSNQLEFIRGNVSSITVGHLETTDPDDIFRATQTEINKRFTFYDQRHITGSDILQPKIAHALMTVNPRVLLRDILQGTLRMRQFMTSQKVHLVVTESLRKFYSSKVKNYGIDDSTKSMRISDVLTLGALNEEEKQSRENEKLAFSKIDAEIRSFVLDEISKQLTQDTFELSSITALFNETRDLFIRSIREDPTSWLLDPKLQNSSGILIQHLKLRLNKLKPLFDSKEAEEIYIILKEKIESMIASLLQFLNTEILVHTNQDIGREVLMQNQTQTLTLSLMQVDLNQLVQQYTLNSNESRVNYELLDDCEKNSENPSALSSKDQFIRLKDIYDDQPENSKLFTESALLSDGNQIGVTKDLIQPFFYGSSNKYPIFSWNTIEGSHLLVYGSLNGSSLPKILLISPEHAAQTYKDIERISIKRACLSYFWLCDLSGDVIITNGKPSEGVKNIFDISKFKTIIEKLIFDLLIFNGSLLQILANLKLESLYKEDWLASEDFKNRAIFLRLRMKVLKEKDLYIFENDEEYLNLHLYSSGIRPAEMVRNFYDGYPKEALNLPIQSIFDQEEHGKAVEILGNNGLTTIENEIARIFEITLENEADESCFDFITCDLTENETNEPDIIL